MTTPVYLDRLADRCEQRGLGLEVKLCQPLPALGKKRKWLVEVWASEDELLVEGLALTLEAAAQGALARLDAVPSAAACSIRASPSPTAAAG